MGEKRRDVRVPVPLDQFRESLLQEVDGSDEVVVVDEHRQVDRIEVSFTPKATA